MNMKLRVSNPSTRGMSRTGVIVLVAAFVVVCGLALVGFKFRQTSQAQAAPAVSSEAEAESQNYQDPNHGFTLTLPANWTCSATPADGPAAMTLITFQSPTGSSMNTLAVWKHPSNAKITPREWAEKEVEAGTRMGKKDGKVRPNSWSDLMLGGRPAASVITDLQTDGSEFTVYHVYAMTDTSSMKFRFMVPASEFGNEKSKVDSLLASFSCK